MSKTTALASSSRKSKKWPLRFVLILPFILQLLAAVGLTSWLALSNGQRAVEDVMAQLRGEQAERIREYVTSYLEIPHTLNEINARAIELGELDFKNPYSLGRHFRSQLDQFDAVTFVFWGSRYGGAAGAGRLRDGTMVVDSTDVDLERGLVAGTRREYKSDAKGNRGPLLKEAAGFDARQRDWFRPAARKRGSVWSPIYLFFAEDSLAIAASRPVLDEQGELLGVLGADLTLQELGRFLESLEIGANGRAFIMEASGRVIASSVDERLFQPDDESTNPWRLSTEESRDPLVRGAGAFLSNTSGQGAPPSADSPGKTGTHQQLSFELDGERQLVDVIPIADSRGLNWRIVLAQPESDFMGRIQQNTSNTLWLTLGALLLATILGLWTARWIARPIIQINRASREITSGNLAQTVEVEGVNELSQLAASFNQMADQLRGSFGELEARVQERTAQLEAAKEAADSANRTKSQFLANISHEIRTPLSAILGYVELLSAPDATQGETLGYLRTIRTNGRHLNQLLGDLLDLSRIEAGKMSLDVRSCRLDRLLAQLGSSFAPRAKEKGLSLTIESRGWLPWEFEADPVRLRQVLSNLLANALAYTEAGGVTLTVSSASGEIGDRRPSEAELIFTVQDTGIGISEKDQRRLFQRFLQLDSSPAKEEKHGFGLGLSITKQLTDLMSGSVEVESVQGRGSSFKVRLPVTACGEWANRTKEHDTSSALPLLVSLPKISGRVLVAEDSKSLQNLCREMLRRWGLDCDVADDGLQALRRVTTGEYDLVLMDWQMPEMDGLDTTRELRRQGVKVPIVALTAAAMDGDREICLDAGCTDYLAKPIDFKELYRLLLDLLGPSVRNEGAEPASTVGLAAASGDADLAQVTRNYVEALPEKLASMEVALRIGDWTSFNGAAHKLAGTAGSYGLEDVFRAAEAIEKAGLLRDIPTVYGALGQLRQAVDRAVGGGGS